MAVWDIEDFVALGKSLKACPYFAARELLPAADIVFCPYNYLVVPPPSCRAVRCCQGRGVDSRSVGMGQDPFIRASMGIELDGNIVVLDEAHNIEDAAREAASLTLSHADLTAAAEDLEGAIGWG